MKEIGRGKYRRSERADLPMLVNISQANLTLFVIFMVHFMASLLLRGDVTPCDFSVELKYIFLNLRYIQLLI